jgi:hypothetical protein
VAHFVLCAGSAAQVRPADQMLINPDPKDWLTYGGSYNSQRYSQLKQVTSANASRLQTKWAYHVDGAEEGEVTPIVANGVMYISGLSSGGISASPRLPPGSAVRQFTATRCTSSPQTVIWWRSMPVPAVSVGM